MVSFPAHAFRYDSLSAQGEGYRDHYFTDTSPKGKQRIWTLSVGDETAEFDSSTYVLLQRSATDDGTFDHDVAEVPKAIVEGLRSLVPIWTGREA